MKTKTLLSMFVLIALLFVAGGLPTTGRVRAQAQNSPLNGTVLGTGFTYQGRLTDTAGNPIAGPCALRFTLY